MGAAESTARTFNKSKFPEGYMVEGSGQRCPTTAVVRSRRKLPNPYRSFKGRASDRVASKVATATGSVRSNKSRTFDVYPHACATETKFSYTSVIRRKTETKTVHIICAGDKAVVNELILEAGKRATGGFRHFCSIHYLLTYLPTCLLHKHRQWASGVLSILLLQVNDYDSNDRTVLNYYQFIYYFFIFYYYDPTAVELTRFYQTIIYLPRYYY